MPKKEAKERLDTYIVKKGLAKSREQAKAFILGGIVYVNGMKVDKASLQVCEKDFIEIRMEREPFVSRGGIKLDAALNTFEIDVKDKVALDVGASTGGFTDCLLKRGAQKVYALDVGYGLLDWKLRRDPRVIPIERFNVRYLKPEDLPEKADIITVDVSFISLMKVIPPLRKVLNKGIMILLVKPQFEVGRGKVGPGGIIRDEDDQKKILKEIAMFCKRNQLSILGIAESAITGAEGNREFLLYLSNHEKGMSNVEILKRIECLFHEKGKKDRGRR
ncbi:MAG: TlyA family RNA methyltransferase [Acidobacteriota bacterium]